MTARGIPARGTRTRETRIARPRRIVVPLASYRRAQGVASSRRRTKRARAPRPVVEAKRAIARGPRINVFKPTSEPASGARPIASEARAAFTRARGTAGEMAENGGAEEAGGSTLWIGDLVRRATRERDGRAAAERYFFFPSKPSERRLRRRRRRRTISRRMGWLASRRGDAARRRPSLASPLASARRLLPLANDVADAIPLCGPRFPSLLASSQGFWMEESYLHQCFASVGARLAVPSSHPSSIGLASTRLASPRATPSRARGRETYLRALSTRVHRDDGRRGRHARAAAEAPRSFFLSTFGENFGGDSLQKSARKKKRWDVD